MTSTGASPVPGRLSVAHVSQPTTDGVAESVLSMIGDQCARGWDVTVVCPPGGKLGCAARDVGARHVVWRASRAPGPATIRETLELRRAVSRLPADVVHLHSSKAGLAGRLALRGRVVVFQPHGWSAFALPRPLQGAAWAWERIAARRTDALVCVSAGERRRAVDAGMRAAWRVVPNGVDVERFAPGAAPLGAASVVCVGRICRAKGQDVLLEAWADVVRAVPDARLTLVGPGALRQALPPGVEHVGRQDDVRPWLAAATVVAVPSRWDGHSVALLEAMASGRPVVATDVAGARESLGPAAHLVPVEDPQALAAALVVRLRDPELRRREAEAARRRVVARFSVEATTAAIADLYSSLLAARAGTDETLVAAVA